MSEQAESYYHGSPDRQCPPAYLKTTLGKMKIPEMVKYIQALFCKSHLLDYSTFYSSGA